jgi:predicted CoA-binding protein
MNMFDNDNTPKYIIGGGYEVIPVSPSTTDVLVSSCNY